MGHWGKKVIQNDIVGDFLCDFIDKYAQGHTVCIPTFLDELFAYKCDYNETQILAIAIVDASVNGVDLNLLDDEDSWNNKEDSLRDFFVGLKKTPYPAYIDLALKKIEDCINDDFYPAEGERLEILNTYKKRLMTYKNKVTVKKVSHK